MTPSVGDTISFYLENFDTGGMDLKTAKVINIISDPLGRHESKCSVTVEGTEYGIPFSEIREIQSKTGTQLNLF